MVNPAPTEVTPPVCNFYFQALDESVDLSSLIADVYALLQHFDNVVKPRIENNIREGALEKGLDAEELLKFRGNGGIKIAAMIRRMISE